MTDQLVTPATEQASTTPTEADTTTIEVVDGPTLVRMFEGASGWLQHHVHTINALNVFPVPDGDTGTNMMATVQSAMQELRSKLREGEPVGDVANRMARGALMGARGNSGVILSQILRGFAKGLEGKQFVTTAEIAEAMSNASDAAYKAVMKPVEGTILTVVREAADAAKQHAHEKNVVKLFHEIVAAAKRAELKTPDLLPVLKEAGVTDSGGHGLWVFLDGALRNLRGETITTSEEANTGEVEHLTQSVGHPQSGDLLDQEWGYDIQYLIRGSNERPLDVDTIRDYINGIGDCALVVGDETLVKVHVHCPNPGPAIHYGAEQGIICDVVVENMDLQAQEFLQEEAPPQVAEAFGTVQTTHELTGVGIVVVAPGEGIAEIFRSLGVSDVVSGGQTMNPSTKDLLDAVEGVDADTVIVLPNNKNIILAAEQIIPLTEKRVHVLPTRTVPQGIAAVMSFNYAGALEENLEEMREAVAHVQTGEVTTAIRTTTIDGVSVNDGDIIGLLNGKLVVAESSPEAVVRAMLDRLELDEYEILTLYHGENVSPDEATAMMEALQESYSSLEVEVVRGGQPHYHYIFSVE
ncbi:MAG TPA: DAK2 domain-containing protein [Ardenticatenaceae bacterium]